MAVRGHVISCDVCGQLMGMPTAMKHADQRTREELVRLYAVGWGWRRAEDGDRCPDHEAAQASEGRLSTRAAGVRSRFSALSRERAHRRTDAIPPIDDRPVTA
jgi:hypothetical protein